ncbi:MAG TPA: isocitrate/isopropylmalate family dehydrogenase, partial [Burkholderiales bacterium]|nr:isocitrate/isopropylmalate family dehydrogenase [Burkholderiales bacterium]
QRARHLPHAARALRQHPPELRAAGTEVDGAEDGLTTNMFGDILSDEAAELAGSLGLAASLNRGDRSAVANAGHGSAPDIAGKDLANPASLMLSTAMLFEHLGAARQDQRMADAAAAFSRAVDARLGSAETRTRDLGGKLGTQAFADAVARAVLDGK